VTTVPLSLRFLHGQIAAMKARGYEVDAISSPGELLDVFAAREEIAVHPIAMTRRISPVHDAIALGRLWALLRRTRPRIVHAHTPKGGLLGTLAASLAGVPVRIYHIHGFRFMTARGLKRRLLRTIEWITCRFASQVYCVSPSLRGVAEAEGICRPEKMKVVLGGSINGVDVDGQFDPEHVGPDTRRQVREQLGIPPDAPVMGYVGRVVRDKGLAEFVAAGKRLRVQFPELHLLVVGPFEREDPVAPDVEQALRSDDQTRITGQVDNPAPYYAAMDVLVLPSYREGLGYTLIEAGSMRLPVVATRIPGCVDAVDDGVTGILVPAHDAPALAAAVGRFLDDPALRQAHGAAGRARVRAMFRREAVWDAMAGEYERLLRARGLPVPEPNRGTGPRPHSMPNPPGVQARWKLRSKKSSV
jgi:glycosyltransferase involved in cell wall biosynthesis